MMPVGHVGTAATSLLCDDASRTPPVQCVLADRKKVSAPTTSVFDKIERALESLTGDPQKMLEAVVGIDVGVATYDRDGIVDYFTARPQKMISRALDFLLAFRRIRAVCV